MPTPKTHPCPGGCGAQVAQDKLACPLDWARLPQTFKDEVLAAWRKRSTDRMGHLRAVSRAYAWYRRNPRKSFLGNSKGFPSNADTRPNRHDALYRSFVDPGKRDEQ